MGLVLIIMVIGQWGKMQNFVPEGKETKNCFFSCGFGPSPNKSYFLHNRKFYLKAGMGCGLAYPGPRLESPVEDMWHPILLLVTHLYYPIQADFIVEYNTIPPEEVDVPRYTIGIGYGFLWAQKSNGHSNIILQPFGVCDNLRYIINLHNFGIAVSRINNHLIIGGEVNYLLSKVMDYEVGYRNGEATYISVVSYGRGIGYGIFVGIEGFNTSFWNFELLAKFQVKSTREYRNTAKKDINWIAPLNVHADGFYLQFKVKYALL
ncbi:MAG TPA: hypothetical protein EYP60_03625 [bacterium (Candidatus Stahlbacteria)]|nr:hypothetical protein [Candidatus Stahlbacteria bacterium]